MRKYFEKRAFGVFAIFMVVSVLGVFACQRDRMRTVEESPSDHPHRLPDTKVVGDYHVSFFADHRRGEIEIFVTDAEERPVRLEEPYIKGIIVYPSGASKDIRFEPVRYELQRITVGRAPLKPVGPDRTNPRIRVSHVPSSAVFIYHNDLLMKEHDFTVEVEVPINHIVHRAGFDYSASPEEDQHHRH